MAIVEMQLLVGEAAKGHGEILVYCRLDTDLQHLYVDQLAPSLLAKSMVENHFAPDKVSNVSSIRGRGWASFRTHAYKLFDDQVVVYPSPPVQTSDENSYEPVQVSYTLFS